jgi:hypothetical protein
MGVNKFEVLHAGIPIRDLVYFSTNLPFGMFQQN